MPLFLIAYNPQFPEENLKKVEDMISGWGGKRAFGSVWIVDRASSAKFLFEALHEHINQLVDSLAIVKLHDDQYVIHRPTGNLTDLGVKLSDR